MKKLQAKKNNAGGYDLLTERDRGNEVLILTGRYANSIKYWERLKDLADQVIYALENENEETPFASFPFVTIYVTVIMLPF